MNWMITHQLNEIRFQPSCSTTNPPVLKWTAPLPDWIKINTDAALNQSGRIGLAAIARDHTRMVISAEINCVYGPLNAFFAESAAALMGTRLLQGGKYDNIILESDALQVVQALHSTTLGRSEAAMLIQDIKRLLPSFKRWQITHTMRQGNQAAHYMAKDALRTTGNTRWTSSLLITLRTLIQSDELPPL